MIPFSVVGVVCLVLIAIGCVALMYRIRELESAIREHRDQKLDDRCWEDDAELYKVLLDGIPADHTLPPRETFLANCRNYYECRGRHPNKEAAQAEYKLLPRDKPA